MGLRENESLEVKGLFNSAKGKYRQSIKMMQRVGNKINIAGAKKKLNRNYENNWAYME